MNTAQIVLITLAMGLNKITIPTMMVKISLKKRASPVSTQTTNQKKLQYSVENKLSHKAVDLIKVQMHRS